MAIQAENGLDFGNALAEAADRGSDSMAEAAKLANRMQIQSCLEIRSISTLGCLECGLVCISRVVQKSPNWRPAALTFLAIAGQCGTSMCMQLPSV